MTTYAAGLRAYLLWTVGLSRRQNDYSAGVALIFPAAKAGKPANTTSLISPRSLLKRCWPEGNGKGSAAVRHQRSADMSLRSPPRPRCGWS
ncbi:hypothetical protein BQ8482_130012 [Mesorhizobium delmotii]|uniref:Uncharacterized protein n=1 Tax=Mesorhizobium delmotii TaxID=1631247 RepID=A0A2P9AG48_9HYPH|nr:hypothetical protein BQ8482_130012 [Mesorhizobium delmotii]